MDEMSRRIQVMFKVIGFLACSDTVATAIIFEIPRLCQMYTSPRGGYPLIWPIRGCAAGQGTFKSLRAITTLVQREDELTLA